MGHEPDTALRGIIVASVTRHSCLLLSAASGTRETQSYRIFYGLLLLVQTIQFMKTEWNYYVPDKSTVPDVEIRKGTRQKKSV